MLGHVMTVRIDAQLLAAVRRRAKQAGRSVSAEVIALLRRELQQVSPARARKTMGMFSGSSFEVPELDDFKRLRSEASSRLTRRMRR